MISSLGVSVNPSLPLLDSEFFSKTEAEIVERTLALFAVVGVSFGFKKNAAEAWLEKEGLTSILTETEKGFLSGHGPSSIEIQSQVECLWALAWVLGLVDQIDYREVCRDDFISVFPDVLRLESSEKFRKRARRRVDEEIIRAVDLAYSMHWAAVAGSLPSQVVPGPVIECRRRALEWVVGQEDWDHVEMST